MKIQLDLSNELTAPELLYLYCIRQAEEFDVDFKKLEPYMNGDAISVSGRAIVNTYVREIHNENDEIEALALKYRELFKGKAPGAMGALGNLKKKLAKFKEEYNYSDEHIIKAITRYIDSVRDYNFLQRADYTVEKNGDSRLLAFCEEIAEGVNDADGFTLDL